jgi:hypothetical protein
LLSPTSKVGGESVSLDDEPQDAEQAEELFEHLKLGQILCVERDLKKRSRTAPFGPAIGPYVIEVEDRTMVTLAEGLAAPARFRVERGNVSFTVSTEAGVPTMRDLAIRGEIAPRVVDFLGIRSLAEQATRALALHLAEGELPLWDEAMAAVQRVYRAKVTQEDVERAADAYRAGGIEAVKRALFIGDRQAWRYVSRAQQQGLVKRQRAPRRAKKKAK